MEKSGLAFHCHHDVLFEYVYDYDERVKFIKGHKPEGEQELRREAYDKARAAHDKAWAACGKAGEAYGKARAAHDKAGEAYDKAGEAYDKARAAHDKAGAAHDKAGEAYDKAREAYDKARAAHDKAWAACGKAGEAYGKANRKELETLHSKLCPDCPWDGKTIFGGNELRLNVYMFFIARTAELKAPESVWLELLDISKN